MSTPPATLSWQAVDPTAVRVWVDGLPFDVVADTPALLTALASRNLHDLLPGLLPDEAQKLAWLDHLFDPRTGFDLPDALAVADAVVTYLTGLPLPAAVALAGDLGEGWLLVRGFHAGRGVDLLALSPRALFATVYAFVVEHRFDGNAADANVVLFPARAPATAVAAAAAEHDGGQGFLAAMAAAGALPGIE